MLNRSAALALVALPLVVACSADTEADGVAEERGETASEIVSAPAGTVLETTARVNLRDGASTSDAIILTMPKGATVTTLEAGTENGFLRVSYKGEEGYAHGSYLTKAGTTTADEDDTDVVPSTGGGSLPWDGKHPDAAKWTQLTTSAIAAQGSSLLSNTPSDIASFCPRYEENDAAGKTRFWVGLIAAMTKYESDFKPATKYTESFSDSAGNSQVSRGLLQLSYDDRNNYSCAISSASALDDPKVNLPCGVRIANHWIKNDGVITGVTTNKKTGKTISIGLARYWSVLRSGKTQLAGIRGMTKNLSVCK